MNFKILVAWLLILVISFSFLSVANADEYYDDGDYYDDGGNDDTYYDENISEDDNVYTPDKVFNDISQSIIMQVNNPNMLVNNAEIEIDPESGAAPMIINDRSMIPIRALIDQLGGDVQWIEKDSEIIINIYSTTVEMYVDYPKAYVDDKEVSLDVPPTVINDRTYIPLRFVAESVKCSVDWDDLTEFIKITPNETNVSTFKELNAILNLRKIRWGGNGFNDKYSTILNNIRIKSGDQFEQGLYDFVENDTEGCYWCGNFLLEEEYLHGNTPLPSVALNVFDIGLSLPVTDDNGESLRVSLSVVAAIANAKYGDKEKAKALKADAEKMMKEKPILNASFPAMYDSEREIYDNL